MMRAPRAVNGSRGLNESRRERLGTGVSLLASGRCAASRCRRCCGKQPGNAAGRAGAGQGRAPAELKGRTAPPAPEGPLGPSAWDRLSCSLSWQHPAPASATVAAALTWLRSAGKAGPGHAPTHPAAVHAPALTRRQMCCLPA